MKPMKMPAVGDVLTVEHHENGKTERVEVRVAATFRYRFAVEKHSDGHLPHYQVEWDIRTRKPMGDSSNYPPKIGDAAYWNRLDSERMAWKYLDEQGIHPSVPRGDLKTAIAADPVYFATVVRRFIEGTY